VFHADVAEETAEVSDGKWPVSETTGDLLSLKAHFIY
jgi:hypothetical protein